MDRARFIVCRPNAIDDQALNEKRWAAFGMPPSAFSIVMR
jgi:hypothetical protein